MEHELCPWWERRHPDALDISEYRTTPDRRADLRSHESNVSNAGPRQSRQTNVGPRNGRTGKARPGEQHKQK
jgi:hypothetical protein